MFRFFLWLCICTSLITGFVLWADQTVRFARPSFFVQTLVLLVLTTSIIYVYLYKARTSAYFTQLYLLTMVVKVLAYCAYILLMVLKDKPAAVENAVFFLVCYFTFTALEIGFLYRKVSGGNKH